MVPRSPIRPGAWLALGVLTALVLIGSSAALLGARMLGNDDWGRDEARRGGSVVLAPDRPPVRPERSGAATRRAQQKATGGTPAPAARGPRRAERRAPVRDGGSAAVRVVADDVAPAPPAVVRALPGDLDGDGLSDALEERIGTDPEHEDTDGDTLPDPWEEQHGLDPTSPADADVDIDGDGLLNRTEFRVPSNPRAFDTNHDGTADGADEVAAGTDPAVPEVPEPPAALEPAPEPPAPDAAPLPPEPAPVAPPSL